MMRPLRSSGIRVRLHPTLRSLLLSLLLIQGLYGSGCTRNDVEGPAEAAGMPPSVANGEERPGRRALLSPEQAAQLNIETVRLEKARKTFRIRAAGEAVASPERIAVISAPVDGRVSRIHAQAGERVEPGMLLLELESLEFSSLAAAFLEAAAEQEYFSLQVERLTVLSGQSITPQSSLERASADLARASARLEAARARLRAIGVDEGQMSRWAEGSEEIPSALPLRSPVGGQIQTHEVDAGQAVHAYDRLMEIVDPAEVLIRGFVDPEERSFLNEGAGVTVRPSGPAGLVSQSVNSTIATIHPGLDPRYRSVVVNSVVATRDHWPVIGQTVQVEYVARTPEAVFTLPLSALHYDGENAAVFVRRGEREFISREVSILRTLQQEVIVSSGDLAEGEEVAVSQVFSLKALSRFEEYAEE